MQPPAAAGDENKTPENKNSLFNEPKPKGGAKKAVSGELKIKREDIKEYYPPPEFDKQAVAEVGNVFFMAPGGIICGKVSGRWHLGSSARCIFL